jgi:hypothetical protein
MKKTALTIGLFSLVVVATSFANPTIAPSTIQTSSEYKDTDVMTGSNNGRKLDYTGQNTTQSNLNQTEGFRQDRQSKGITIKLD